MLLDIGDGSVMGWASPDADMTALTVHTQAQYADAFQTPQRDAEEKRIVKVMDAEAIPGGYLVAAAVPNGFIMRTGEDENAVLALHTDGTASLPTASQIVLFLGR